MFSNVRMLRQKQWYCYLAVKWSKLKNKSKSFIYGYCLVQCLLRGSNGSKSYLTRVRFLVSVDVW